MCPNAVFGLTLSLAPFPVDEEEDFPVGLMSLLLWPFVELDATEDELLFFLLRFVDSVEDSEGSVLLRTWDDCWRHLARRFLNQTWEREKKR